VARHEPVNFLARHPSAVALADDEIDGSHEGAKYRGLGAPMGQTWRVVSDTIPADSGPIAGPESLDIPS